jgi:hypothetical protein
MTPLPPNPFMFSSLDENVLLAAIEEEIQTLPAFIESPRPEYMAACEIEPIVQILAGYMR